MIAAIGAVTTTSYVSRWRGGIAARTQDELDLARAVRSASYATEV